MSALPAPSVDLAACWGVGALGALSVSCQDATSRLLCGRVESMGAPPIQTHPREQFVRQPGVPKHDMMAHTHGARCRLPR